jgi:hypothetical protein
MPLTLGSVIAALDQKQGVKKATGPRKLAVFRNSVHD